MSRLQQVFADARRKDKKVLSIYLTVGYPSLESTEAVAAALAEAGVGFFELGFPFSDPIADGPTIQKTSYESLRAGVHFRDVCKLAQNLRRKTQVPLVLMSYSNVLFRRGWEKSADDLKAAGFDGVIVPDMIPEESAAARKIFASRSLDFIHLAAPTSGADRLKAIAGASSGFVYCVSVTGVTGARAQLPEAEISRFLKSVRAKSQLPTMLGFGISEPAQIKKFSSDTDGFIIGSKMMELLQKGGSAESLAQTAKQWIRPFVEVL